MHMEVLTMLLLYKQHFINHYAYKTLQESQKIQIE